MTRIAASIAALLLGAALLPAQLNLIAPGFVPPDKELKAYLNLTDSQVDALRQVQENRAEAERAIYQQINEKQRLLHSLLESGSRDAVQIGQLMIDIATLQKQVPPGASFRESALAVLTPDQKGKLPFLSTVLLQQNVAWQAVNWNLIDPPPAQIRSLPLETGPGLPIVRTLPLPVDRVGVRE